MNKLFIKKSITLALTALFFVPVFAAKNADDAYQKGETTGNSDKLATGINVVSGIVYDVGKFIVFDAPMAFLGHNMENVERMVSVRQTDGVRKYIFTTQGYFDEMNDEMTLSNTRLRISGQDGGPISVEEATVAFVEYISSSKKVDDVMLNEGITMRWLTLGVRDIPEFNSEVRKPRKMANLINFSLNEQFLNEMLTARLMINAGGVKNSDTGKSDTHILLGAGLDVKVETLSTSSHDSAFDLAYMDIQEGSGGGTLDIQRTALGYNYVPKNNKSGVSLRAEFADEDGSGSGVNKPLLGEHVMLQLTIKSNKW